ncbi:MAG: hypothetical protein M1828_002173 [Chrysothrix sp. TS-e1954]|nr:MAG: hypothetical protein M1828_002173 [Chrysothrix sp. TS-e1954]
MSLRTAIIAVGSIGAVALAQAQSVTASPSATSVSPSETAAFSSALSSYFGAAVNSPEYQSLGLAIAGNLPASVLQSIEQDPQALIPIPTSNADLASLATDPPLTFPTYTWETSLPSSVQDEVKSLQTMAVLAAASIDRSVIGLSGSVSVPTASAASATATASTGGSARATGGLSSSGISGLASAFAAALVAGFAVML